MNQNPQLLQNFYKENSIYTHGNEVTFGSNDETVCGVEEINKKIQKLDFRDAKVTLSVVDCQASSSGGFIILVVGTLSNKGEAPRKFVQTFFLAEQQKGIFFVLNDVFRYLDVKSSVTSSPILESTRNEESARPQQEQIESELKPKEIKTVQVQASNLSSESNSSSLPKENIENQSNKAGGISTKSSNSQQPAVSIANNAPPPKKETINSPELVNKVLPSPLEEKIIPTGPKLWSNIAATASEIPSTTPPVAPIKKTTPPPNQTQTQKSNSQKEEKIHPGNALFVSNVPFNATEEQVRTAFLKFGGVQSVSIIQNKGYVFLELVSVEAAQKAIQSGKDGELVIDGRKLSVEERKPKKEGAFKERRDDRGTRNQRGEDRRNDKRTPNGKSSRGPNN